MPFEFRNVYGVLSFPFCNELPLRLRVELLNCLLLRRNDHDQAKQFHNRDCIIYTMSKPCIITVAINGSVARKSHNPAVPESITEQVESTHEAFEAGASLVHVHSRNDDGTPGTLPDKFAKFQESVKKHCPGIIVQFSTGGRSGKGSDCRHEGPPISSSRSTAITRTF